MLTPIDIENKTFKTGIGYDRKDVDAFLIELQESYEKIYKQNLEFREETKETARVSAEAIETQALAKAKDILADAKSDLEEIKLKTQALLSQYNVYKAQYRQILQTQLELLENDSFEIMLEQERGGGVFEEEELAEEE